MFVEIKDRRIPLEPGHLYMLGKESNALINKNDSHFISVEDKDNVDEKHCLIEVIHNDDVFIVDLYSSLGTLLNNQPLKSLERTRLKTDDIVQVGSQEIKFFFERKQKEMSHDSSGFLDVNRNTSDIVVSSPEYTSQRESRIKRLNNNNFLVPPVPHHKSSTSPSTSIVITKANKASGSLNSPNTSSNSRNDSFTIPETQCCKSRTSLNSTDCSIAESIPEANASKIKFNFGNLDDEDDEFCIPETQEPEQISDNQKLRVLVNDKMLGEATIIEEKTNDLEAEDSTKDLHGSQFRMTTQEFNEGFGEEMGSLHSQIIPIIKHSIVVLNASTESAKNTCDRDNTADKEISALKCFDAKDHQETLRADCSTPDLFDFNDLEQNNKEMQNKKEDKTNGQHILEEDEDDLLPTQIFSLQKPDSNESKKFNDIDRPCVEKENEEILTSSDKENKCPVALEPVTDLPPGQLFATSDALTSRSTLSNSSRSSNSGALKTHSFAAPASVSSSAKASVENKKNSKSLLDLDPDDEDDLLTQAFLLPPNPNLVNTTNRNVAVKCFNSTLLDEKSVDKNAATFFAEMEKTSSKQSTLSGANRFKLPEKDYLAVKKTSSALSVTSETDLDLLMCTPQLIKDHLKVGIQEDLGKNILAAKNKHLFGDYTDEDEINDGQTDLVKLINVPKDFKDFDELLPHLKEKSVKENFKESKEQKAAEEAQKEYRFSISFGKEQQSKTTSSSKLSKSTRDERHMARDKERELAERKEKLKGGQNEIKGKKNKTVKDNTPKKMERNTRSRKRLLSSTDTIDLTQENDDEKPKDSKQNKSAAVKTNAKTKETRKTKETAKTKKSKEKLTSTKEEKEDKTKEANSKNVNILISPSRRMTRSKSICEDKASTSKEALNNNKATLRKVEAEDDTDSVSTQPFVRIARRRNTSKNDESLGSTTSNSSLYTSDNKSKTERSSTENTPADGTIKKTLSGRKRKAEPTTAKTMERKRLKSTHTPESSDSKNFSSNVYISMTMVEPELFKELEKSSNGLWSIPKDPAESEILVMDKAFRTFKFLLAMARGIPIVTSEYLRKVNELNSIKKVCITDYLFSDAEFENRHKFSLAKSLQMARKQKLFKNYEFLMTPNIVPNPGEMKAIIEAAGGLVHTKAPTEHKKDQQIYLISSADDKKDWHKYRRLYKNITIISTEAIMTSVMRQTCARISRYTLS